MNWLKCREVLEQETFLRDSGKKPGWVQRAGILFHMALCRTCRVYMRQVASLQALVHCMAGRGTDPSVSLSEDRKERMRNLLEREAQACGCNPVGKSTLLSEDPGAPADVSEKPATALSRDQHP
jgi:hypothetical protein